MLKVSDNLVYFPEHGLVCASSDDEGICKQLRQVDDAYGQGDLCLIPCNAVTCKLLYDLGFVEALEISPFMAAPHPLVEGCHKPMKHQLLTAAFMALHPRAYVLSEPRTGKTGAVMLALNYMRKQHMFMGGALIITTVTTMHGVWKESLVAALPKARVLIAHGSRREQTLSFPADYYITNYDSCRISKEAFLKAVKEKRIGAIVIDELTNVGNSTSQRHKAIAELCNKSGVEYVWGLTGSPADNPEMVFGMCRAVNPVKLPCTHRTAWVNLTTFQWGRLHWQRSLAKGAKRLIHETMQPAIRFLKKDIIDLPPVTTQIRSVELSKEQKEARERLRADAYALLQSGVSITAANGGVLLGKIMQVSLGIVRTDTESLAVVPHQCRTRAILEAIEETSNKVVVFCGYIAAIDMLVREIRDAGHTCEKIDGSVTGKERARILDEFQNKDAPHVLVCHPTTTAMGTELSRADTMIFNGVPLVGGFIYAQSVERLSSAKQKADNINIIHIVATDEEMVALRDLQKGYDTGRVIAKTFEYFAKNS